MLVCWGHCWDTGIVRWFQNRSDLVCLLIAQMFLVYVAGYSVVGVIRWLLNRMNLVGLLIVLRFSIFGDCLDIVVRFD